MKAMPDTTLSALVGTTGATTGKAVALVTFLVLFAILYERLGLLYSAGTCVAILCIFELLSHDINVLMG